MCQWLYDRQSKLVLDLEKANAFIDALQAEYYKISVAARIKRELSSGQGAASGASPGDAPPGDEPMAQAPETSEPAAPQVISTASGAVALGTPMVPADVVSAATSQVKDEKTLEEQRNHEEAGSF